MWQIGKYLIVLIVLAHVGCASTIEPLRASTRVLFVGNSITYYHGAPYLFSEVADGLYGKPVVIDFLVQPGGHLADVLRFEETIAQVRRTDYDIVVLQEWGSQLLCGASKAGRDSPTCVASLTAHRSLAEIAGGGDSMTILLGTYQPNLQVAAALMVGEKWFFESLEFDRYVRLAPVLLNGEASYPQMSWRANDGIHPGPDLALAIALAVANAAFGPTYTATDGLEVFETLEHPTKTLSYEEIETDLSIFHEGRRSVITSDVLESIRYLPESLQRISD